MPYVVADRVKETTTSTGTGNITLAGAATGFKTFSSTIGVGNTTTYVIADATGSQWEVGLGTLSGSTTLVRTSVFSNSAGTTTQINFSAGTKSVFVSMSAAPRLGNVALGTDIGFSPNSYQYTTVIGGNATASANGATAIGQYTTASGGNATAVGGGATASNQNAVAVGESANASGAGAIAIGSTAAGSSTWAIAIGDDAYAYSQSGISIGYGAQIPGGNTQGIAIGESARADLDGAATVDQTIAIGKSAKTNGGITIGSQSGSLTGGGNRSIIIGRGITPLADDATYMNKFRTGVTPVGTSWTLKWDDSTKEVYADPGGGPPTGPNWYTYETVAFPGGSFSLAMPSGMPTSSFGSGGALYSSQAVFGGSVAPIGGMWSYSGSTGYYNSVYGAFSPATDPTSYSGSGYGTVVVYYSGYETDSGTSGVHAINTGTTLYFNFGTFLYCSTFSAFGSTRHGHAIVAINGNYAGTITPSSGVTLVEEFYDSASNYTFAFFDLDTTAVSNASFGTQFAMFAGPASYETIFWYNYS